VCTNLVRQFNEEQGTDRLSTDRLARYLSLSTRDIGSNPLALGSSLQLFDDVAIKFEDNKQVWAEYGRVIRMRKTINKSWVEYTKPVDLNDGATAGLHLICYYYKEMPGSATSLTFDTKTGQSLYRLRQSLRK